MASNEHGDAGVLGGEPPQGFEVEIRSPDFELTPALRAYTLAHLSAKLAKRHRRIQAVIVRFEDANGSKRGVDKVCRVEVIMPGEDPHIVEETHEDLRAAIDLAADRIEVAVQRDLERRRTNPRQRGGRLVRNQKIIH